MRTMKTEDNRLGNKPVCQRKGDKLRVGHVALNFKHDLQVEMSMGQGST